MLTESADRRNLLKSACLISQKRPVGFAVAEGDLADSAQVIVCDLNSASCLSVAERLVKSRGGKRVEVIYLFDTGMGMDGAKSLVIGKGMWGTWKSDLAIDSRSNWAKLLGALEQAQKYADGAVEQGVAGKAGPAMPKPVAEPEKVVKREGETITGLQARMSAAWGNAVTGKKAISVLLVDDSESAREFVKKKLKESWEESFEFDVAETGQEAKQKCQEKKYDILFLDVVLPDLDGYAVCKNLKNTKNVDSLAVMLTSKGGAFDKLKGVMSGCDMYLVKPLDDAQIESLAKKFAAK